MSRDEAGSLMRKEIASLRALSYDQLRARVPEERGRFLGITIVRPSESEDAEVTGPSGAVYQVQTQFLWDDKPGGDLRVIVAIDGGGVAATRPLSSDFIRAPDGSFVDE